MLNISITVAVAALKIKMRIEPTTASESDLCTPSSAYGRVVLASLQPPLLSEHKSVKGEFKAAKKAAWNSWEVEKSNIWKSGIIIHQLGNETISDFFLHYLSHPIWPHAKKCSALT